MALVQFALVPDFSHLVFGDDALVSEALYHVLQYRNEKDPGDQLLEQICKGTGCSTVGELRQLTDADWRAQSFPAICRVYLKYCVRQSGRRAAGTAKNFMELLQDDFNFGLPFDMSLYQNHISMLAAMGFKTEEAMEALLITENKGIEGALEILFQQDPALTKRRREEAVKRLNRTVPKKLIAVSKNPSSSGSGGGDMATLQFSLSQQKQQVAQLEGELKNSQAALRLQMYESFLRGVVSAEAITVTAFEQLNKYHRDKNITDKEHEQTLTRIGYTMDQFNAMKQFKVMDKRDTECIVCLDKPKDHVITPCNHLCLCEECAEDFSQPNSKCPLCSKPVKKVMRVYL